VLLRIERHSGHKGADMIKAEVEKAADRYAFALAHTAAKPSDDGASADVSRPKPRAPSEP
jgi:hypothetical protein